MNFWTLLCRHRFEWSRTRSLLFLTKAWHWYLCASQIRLGYVEHAAKLKYNKMTSKGGRFNHYRYIVYTFCPFLVEIDVGWKWIFQKTTLEYLDAIKLEYMHRYTYLARCRLERLAEDNRALGNPQPLAQRFLFGSAIIVGVNLAIWGPLLLYTVVTYTDTLDLLPVDDVKLEISLKVGHAAVGLGEYTISAASPPEMLRLDADQNELPCDVCVAYGHCDSAGVSHGVDGEADQCVNRCSSLNYTHFYSEYGIGYNPLYPPDSVDPDNPELGFWEGKTDLKVSKTMSFHCFYRPIRQRLSSRPAYQVV